jgi:predicted transcriptional regulator
MVSEEVVSKIVSLRAEGKTQAQIGEAVGLSQPQVSIVLREAGPPAVIAEAQDEATNTTQAEDSVHLIARNPNEMALARTNMEQWLRHKIAACEREENELFAALEKAMSAGWDADTLKRHSALAEKRTRFYRKALIAVEAGYTLVPNFPIDVFAMRVKRSSPPRHDEVSNYSTPRAHVPEPSSLPAGEGRYVSGETVRGRKGDYIETKDGKEIKKYFFTTTDYSEVEFPIAAAQAEVMTATQEAMALKVFDAIGICPPQRKGDPLIIGQIMMPGPRWNRRTVSFLIAWHLDLRTL